MDYSPKQALDVILMRLRGRDLTLAAIVQAAVDEGKYIEKSERIQGKKEQQRTFKKITKLTEVEALQRALRVLESYFIEQPMFWSSLGKELQDTSIAVRSVEQEKNLPLFRKIEDKETTEISATNIENRSACIDFESEAQLNTQEHVDVFEFPHDLDEAIVTQRQNFSNLKLLTNFGAVNDDTR